MVKTFTLPADTASLRIEVSENGWARLTLVNEKEIYLGADGVDVVASRLMNYLKHEDVRGRSPAGQIEGEGVYCLLMLFEAHHVLHVTGPGKESKLLWQAARYAPVSIVNTMRLTPPQRQQWIETLSEALKQAELPLLAVA